MRRRRGSKAALPPELTASVEGILLDAAGGPVPRGCVAGWRRRGPHRLSFAQARRSGRFRLWMLPGTHALVGYPPGDRMDDFAGDAAARGSPLEVRAGDRLRDVEVRLPLPRDGYAHLEVTLRGPDGGPLAGALVNLMDGPATPTWPVRASWRGGESDARGRISFPWISAEDRTLVVSGTGASLPACFPLRLAVGGRIRVRRSVARRDPAGATTLRVRCVDPRGRGIEGARVSLRADDPGRTAGPFWCDLGVVACTGRDGRVAFRRLPDWLEVSHAWFLARPPDGSPLRGESVTVFGDALRREVLVRLRRQA